MALRNAYQGPLRLLFRVKDYGFQEGAHIGLGLQVQLLILV